MSDPAISHIPNRSSAAETGEFGLISNGQLPWDDDPHFSRLIENRRIAVAGPARTLIGRKGGEWIDSHDLVVRFNDAFTYMAYADSSPSDLGSRTNVLYCNQVILRKDILEGDSARRRFITFAGKSGLQYVVCTNNSLSYLPDGSPATRCERKDRDIPRIFARFLADEIPGTSFRVVTTASALLVKWLKGNWGRTGFIGLVDLLGYRPDHVSVHGMTFYHGGGHLSAQGPELHPQGNRDGSSSISPHGFGHDSFRELELMRELMSAFGTRISVDDVLRALIASKGKKEL
ncbi:MAG: glycosyltransferase family 29 protein [Bacteroidota bacterium]